MEKATESMSNRSLNFADEHLHVATLGRTVGLKGEMKLHLHTDFPEQFVAGAIFLSDKGERIELISYERGLVRLVGYSTPEAAKKLTNTKLFTTHEATRQNCPLEEGEFFWFDILGLDVIEGEELLGVVEDIDRIGAVDYLHVRTSDTLCAQGLAGHFLIPYVERFVLSCDLSMRRILIQGGRDILEAS